MPSDQPVPVPSRSRNLWRLRPYLRPHVWRLALMFCHRRASVSASASRSRSSPARSSTARSTAARSTCSSRSDCSPSALGITEVRLVCIRRWAQSRAVSGLETTLRHDLYVRLQSLPMEFHTRWQSGQLLSRVTVDLSTIRRFMGFGLLFLVINILQLIVVTILLLNLYWPLGIVVLAAAVPIIWLSLRFEKRYLAISRRVQDQQGDLATQIEESALGFRVIKAFGRREHVKSAVRRRRGEAVRHLGGEGPAGVAVLDLPRGDPEPDPGDRAAARRACRRQRFGDPLGTLVAFITLMLSLIWPVESLGAILAMAQEAMTSADRISEILDTESTIASGADRAGRTRAATCGSRTSASGSSPTPPTCCTTSTSTCRPVRRSRSSAPPVSGKTTLTALVPRLYDVTGGRITIDGHDIRDLTLSSLRRAVASAFDDPTLFSMSVRENVTLGRPDATEADVQQALQIAQATFANDLPWGLDTRVGEQGMSLSGGQRQRLALARAVLAEPAVLVLDDTLSALDVHTEALVEEALRKCWPGPPASWSHTARRR